MTVEQYPLKVGFISAPFFEIFSLLLILFRDVIEYRDALLVVSFLVFLSPRFDVCGFRDRTRKRNRKFSFLRLQLTFVFLS